MTPAEVTLVITVASILGYFIIGMIVGIIVAATDGDTKEGKKSTTTGRADYWFTVIAWGLMIPIGLIAGIGWTLKRVAKVIERLILRCIRLLNPNIKEWS